MTILDRNLEEATGRMNDPAVTGTLLLRARRLAALARAKGDDEGASQDQSQAQTALSKLGTELSGLASALAIRRSLKRAGVPVDTIMELDRPAIALRERVASQGRPTAQYLNARVRDVAGLRSEITESDKVAWRRWAEAQISSLPQALLPRLGLGQDSAKERIRKLRLAAVTTPNRSDITLFMLSLDRVRDTLAAVEDAGDLNALLARFNSNGGRLRLSEVTDEDLALIRNDASLAEQIFLSTT
jgi:hypothetical protein